MSIIDDHKVHFARFTNDDKNIIQIELVAESNEDTGDDDLQLFEYTIAAAEGDADFEALLKYVSIDDIHENTVNWIRRERNNFEEAVLNIAKENDLIQTIEPTTSTIWDSVADLLFEEFDIETQKEQLFMLKLKLFENEAIKASKDRSTKAKLRKAKDFPTALKHALAITHPE